MKRLPLLVFVAVLLALVAYASDMQTAIVQGVGIQTFVGIPGGRYSVQCVSIDGGTGQKVWYRPGGCPGCVVDAGLGDDMMDFSANSDPVKIDLWANEDRIHFGTFLNYSSPLYCTVARRLP